MLTLDQIEEIMDQRAKTGRPVTKWEMEKVISLSLCEAANRVGLPFQQCDQCHGAGFTQARLLAGPRMIQMASQLPDEPVPIAYDRCPRCRGSGGWIAAAK